MPPDVLSELRDLHLPEAPGWWPPAPGWWLVAAAIVVLVVCGYYLLKRSRSRARRLRPLREALAELSAYNQSLHARALAPMGYLDQVNGLLKRLLMHGYGEHQLAGLSSEAWTRALNECLRRLSKTDESVRLETSLLGEFRYLPHMHRQVSTDLQDDLQAACEQLGAGLTRVLSQLTAPQATP